MTRLDLDTLFMMQAVLQAERGTCLRAKVGAVITMGRRVVSTGYVGAPPGESHCLDVGCLMHEGHCVRTVHAEANAIAYAARSGLRIEGATLYTTLEPCRVCQQLAVSAGISSVMFLKTYHNNLGSISDSLEIRQLPIKLHTHPFIAWGGDGDCLFCGSKKWSHS